MALEYLNKDNPVDVYKYAVDKHIIDQKSYYCWARDMMKQSERCIGKAKYNVKNYI